MAASFFDTLNEVTTKQKGDARNGTIPAKQRVQSDNYVVGREIDT